MSTEVVEIALEKFGRVDAIVNNAAIGPLGTVLDTDEELFDRIIAVNLKGPYLMSRAALPHMIRAGRRLDRQHRFRRRMGQAEHGGL